jgi:hypothetical protein
MIKRTKQRQEMMKAKPKPGVDVLLCSKQENESETHPSNSSQASDVDDGKVQFYHFKEKRTPNEKENDAGIYLAIFCAVG